MDSPLLIPVFIQILWTTALYIALTAARAPSVWHIGLRSDGTNPLKNIEARISANLSNQFEWPVLFYGFCLLITSLPHLFKPVYWWLAWVFIAGRLAHSAVQIFTANVKTRGLVFAISFIAVLWMWCLLGTSLYLK